ncbi:PREDICTED: activating signal cointegrator 1 complex subunit 2 [Papilio polytes]|uniref:activating signal cointegrator 1 complex subunit 2 n=1 Tax=Papilio polytes TaxID=76194 RepID=UPI0006769A14|nr:PREDICTED: activating signal cointegrator 1 complex subunit 2 [Papilio polytes]
MTNIYVEFVNPDYLPVEKLTLSVSNDGVVQNIKALDTYWVEKRKFPPYERPPSSSNLVLGAVDAWIMKMKVYLEDLKFLLALPHHRFWSTILYHTSCMDALVSFLQEASPPYMPPHENKDVQKLYEEIRRLVLIIFSRLITNKESKICWMSKEYMASLVYDRFVFTVPVIWDICLTYGVDNQQHVARLLDAVFRLQPQYERDTAAAIAFVKEAFKYIILQVNKDYDSDEPLNLPETFKGFSEIRRPSGSTKDKLTQDVLQDLVLHVLDTALTLRIFIETYPNAVHIYRKTNLILTIVQLYEYGIPQLYERLGAGQTAHGAGPGAGQTEGHLELARAELINILREMLAVYKNNIFSGEGSIASHVEDFLSLVLEVLAEKLLIRDYHLCYPLNDDLELLRQAYPDIDTVKTDFILQAIYSNLEEPLPDDILINNANLTNGHVESADSEQRALPAPTIDNEIPDNIREESLITEVKDILPHLGDGFILKCLQHYGFNAERVINSLLEDNLAEPLKALDRSLPIIPADVVDQKFLETGIQRLNVFDGDEFDLMTRDDVDLSRVHLGKRRAHHKDLAQLLDDKAHVRTSRDIYAKYSLVCDEVAMYSDEYDDTYEAEAPHVSEAEAEDARRPFVTPRVLAQRPETESEEEEEETQKEQEVASASRNKLDFCVNPEEVRARREAAWQARRGAARGARGARQPPRNMDVVGKARGQGQDKEVVANRERKEKHKSSRANHNRRQGAQAKRSRAMVPS